jgi:hypothetical protein
MEIHLLYKIYFEILPNVNVMYVRNITLYPYIIKYQMLYLLILEIVISSMYYYIFYDENTTEAFGDTTFDCFLEEYLG